MLRASPNIVPLPSDLPTVWGLDPMELHDRYWASRSVCVVRPGALTPPPRRAELFLLADVRTLARFSLREVLQRLLWAGSELIFVRLRARQTEQYRETVRTDAAGRFLGFTRHYDGTSKQVARLALTRDRRVAELWRSIDSAPSTWRSFRKQTRRWRRQALAVEGELYDRFCHEDLDHLVSDLIQTWPRPSASIEGLHEIRPGVWASDGHDVSTDTVFLGPAWIGAGRRVGSGESVLGPAALWDVASRRPDPGAMCWERLDPSAAPPLQVRPRQIEPWRRRTKRLFDVAFSVGALLGTLPLYPLIMLAIWLEDGGPFIFAHKRETLGGREFPCLKFRSMRKDADRMKAELAMRNESDGPQFFMKNDPRITRVGQFLRRSNLDELPQFINVLLGHMSVVGPRPSPRAENQCCPPWREARLSVRPGITGLWQVSRTRGAGLDFQEWIKFDMQYVERANWRLDLVIILKTLRLLVGK